MTSRSPGPGSISWPAVGISAQVGYNAAHRIQPSRVRRVAVVGDGIIGLTSALTAIQLGFEGAVVVRREDRLSIAADAGAAVIGSGSSVVDETAAFRPEAIIDTIQTGDSFEIVINALPSDYGQVVYSGFTPGMPDAWASIMRLQQRSITAPFRSGWTRERLATVIECIETDEFGFSKIPIAQLGTDHAATVHGPDRGRDGPCCFSHPLAEGRMKIMITGAPGWLGRRVAAQLESTDPNAYPIRAASL